MTCLLLSIGTSALHAQELGRTGLIRLPLNKGWAVQSSALVGEEGEVISSAAFRPKDWYPTSVPSTVLRAMIRNNVYPDVRIGLNSFRIPDASEEFNAKNDLAQYSHLPDKRNPWKDPYWFRTEFTLAEIGQGRHIWLNFKGINYRADVWVNGKKVADHQEMVGIYRRFRFDVTNHVKPGKNGLAAKVFPVDHPATPDTQLEPFGKSRDHRKELMKDVTFVMGIGYDCMPTVPDRNMGIWQEVYIDSTGPVDIRDPFVETDLPLPKTDPAYLKISADVVNVTQTAQKGVLKCQTAEGAVTCETKVELPPGQTQRVVFAPETFPQLVLAKPRLWWPKNYGEQNLYRLRLTFETDSRVSDEEDVTFGIREVTKELHEFKGTHGLRVHVNGKKVFVQGGWLQPEILFDMPARRMETEVRYLTEANLNTVTFEDIPVPCDEFLEACDRHGLMFWCSFYSSFWVERDHNWPLDHELLAACAVDVIKRYRNHPSLVLYSCVGEGIPGEDVYRTWRRNLLELDKTRLFVPTVDVRYMVDWLTQDVPTGLHDAVAFGWWDPAEFYQKVREGKKWMFNTEVGLASFPPVEHLTKFMPDLFGHGEAKPFPFPVDKTWAHHDMCKWHKENDGAIRYLAGQPQSVEDYCMTWHVATAMQHRAWSEAVNHRMWDITSGLWEWKLNSCWPAVSWQIYDWYLKPTPSFYYYKLAYEPLHVQFSPLDSTVTVVNRRLEPATALEIRARVYDSRMTLRWENRAKTDVGANTYRDVFAVAPIPDQTPIYFVQVQLTGDQGKLVSENFYWLSTKSVLDYARLAELPPVTLNVSSRTEDKGDECLVRTAVANPTDRLAFFIHLIVTKGPQGEEVVPVFWDNNYFSLLPKESRQISARFAKADLAGAAPCVVAGGWNIRSAFECTALKASGTHVKPGEAITVTAAVRDTFVDGSPLDLLVDGGIAATKRIWARGRVSRETTFPLRLPKPGRHEVRVGSQKMAVEVE